MVDYDFYTQQAERLNLNRFRQAACYYIGAVKSETEMLRYNFYDKSVTVWPRVYYWFGEIRTEAERIEVNTNEGLEEQCKIIQMNIKKLKMKHRLSKMKEDF